ncbi:uncharacterized protein B0I36DRAFT_361671 [Microdochium trichocladiopsis]|uniref:Uncharacterized protein n=1 Tax=Microdochium trichocladiopsis TaxID=1682393 RepID=A0A9P8Y913_9PEZI|nr:uncharacterized protein B0I36DRAFT_361671 [Microdochium trichocladiopsis]KAH7032931.1 hypothetical protein B0I36DRAFT_361671 [Microdochium trichocladiopsis]
MSGIPGYNGENGFYIMPNGAQAGLPINMTNQMVLTNSTLSVINEFKLLAAKSMRQSTIILSAFNGAAGLIVIIGILVHCYMAAARRREVMAPKIAVLHCIRGPELYPFVLSISIICQAVMLAVVQAQGLNGVYLAQKCPELSGVVWLAWFIVPYTQMVLGLEAAGRAVRSSNFRPKGKFAALKCIVLILVLVVGTGSVSVILPAQPICFASMPWFIARWAVGAFVILTTVTVVLAISAVTLFRQLSRHLLIENDQRIEGSRMVYFLALGAVSNAFMIPFFFNLTFGSAAQTEPGNTLAMVVMVVVNLSGVLNGALYLFLRRGSLATISPRGHRFVDVDDQIYKIQARSPQQVDFNDHLKQPVPGFANMRWMESSDSLNSIKKAPLPTSDNPPATYIVAPVHNAQPAAVAAQTTAPVSYVVPPKEPELVQQQQSVAYPTYPSNRIESTQSFGLLPSTTYDPNQEQAVVSPVTPGFDFLRPPPSVIGHRRASSLASSATVRIGLRISNVDDMRAIADRQTRDSAVAEQFAMPAMPTNSAMRPSPLASSRDANRSSAATNTDKVLPPVPVVVSPTRKPASPTKTVSPRGVGFNLPRRGPSPVEETAVPAPLRVRGGSESRSLTSAWI